MPRLQSRQIFQPSCPSGGTWYSCGGGSRFVGCCTRDPCNSVGCADGNLRAASFNTDYYGNFSDAVCPSNSQFYTCTATKPAFLGCCKQNACRADGNAGCPQADLTAAQLPDNAAQASAYSPTGGPSSTASSSATASPSSSSSSSSTAGIVGGVIGAVAVLLIVIGALLWRRRQQRKKKALAAAGANTTINEADGRPISEMGGGAGGVMGGSGKPPRYSSLTNPGSPNPYAMELDGFPRKAPHEQQTPSELASGDDHQLHAELPGDESGGAVVLHELEGSSPGTTFTGTPATVSSGSPSSKKASHSRGSSWSSFVERRAARRASGGGGGGNTTTGPTGLAIQGLHPYSQVGGGGGGRGGSPRSSPRSPNFPRGEGGGDDAGSESGVSSLPSTPRSAYGYGPGAGTMGGYSDVSRLSPTYPPPIREEERYRDRDDDDDGDVSDGNRNERR